MEHSRYPMFVTIILTVFALSAMRTIPVLADDSAPPPPTDAPAVIDTPSTEAAPVQVEAVSTDIPVVEEQPVPADTTASIPEGTDVAVTNVDGKNLPLASKDADAVINNDPMWCPTGVAPKAGIGECSPSFDHFGFSTDSSSLIYWLVINQQNKAGTIWVQYDYNDSAFETTPSINLKSTDYATMDNFALTIQGGWQGTPASTALHTADPYSYFTHSTLTVSNWTGAVTINNLFFNGTSTNVAADDAALTVSTKGSIKLTNVIAQNNLNQNPSFSRSGIILNNNTGTAGTITLMNITSIGNEGDGLDIYARGAVTATNSIVENNGTMGAYINNSFAPTDQPVTLKGFQQFNGNGSVGLYITSSGLVTLGNLSVSGNIDHGVLIDNRSSTGAKGVTINGTNLFSNNGLLGLIVASHGNISLNNITSIYNGVYGVSLNNCDNNGTGCAGKGAINMTGVNLISNNVQEGLVVVSFGAITVSNLTASSNGNDSSGAILVNNACNFDCSINSKAPITLLGYGIFMYNNYNAGFTRYGLQAESYGTITTNNLTASVNGTDGAYLNGNAVVVKGVNVFNYNGGIGLEIIAKTGTTTVSNVTANGNDNGGINITNSGSGVLLSGFNTANDNKSTGIYLDSSGFVTVNNITTNGNLNFGNGLYINSYSTITVNNVTANGNSSDGVFLENDKSASKPVNVTLNGFNTFNENGIGGMEIYSYGAVVINNATANNNVGYHGIYVNNQNFFIAKPVTFIGFVVANANHLDGVDVLSDGIVTMSNITASQNLDEGLNIDNSQVATRQNAVSILGSNFFYGNDNSGLFVTSYGTITLNNVTSNGNGSGSVNSYAAFLNNTGGLLAKNVTLTGVNNFNQNYVQGLWIYTDGAASLNRVNADNNDWDNADDGLHGDGIVIYAGGNITLTCAHTAGNVGNGYGYGYELHSAFGTVFLKGIYSHYNGSSIDFATGTPVITACALP